MFQGYAIRLSIHAVEGNEMEDKAQYVVHSAFASSDLDKMCEVLSHVCDDADRRIEQEGGENWYAPSYMEHPDDHEPIGRPEEDEAPRLLPDEYAQITLVCGACHRQHFMNEHQWIRAEYLATCEKCGAVLEPLSVAAFKAELAAMEAQLLEPEPPGGNPDPARGQGEVTEVDMVKVEYLSGNRPGVKYMYPPLDPWEVHPPARESNKLPPNADGLNEVRADRADLAIQTFLIESSAEWDGSVRDLLCAMMHWCDKYGEDFEEALDCARVDYRDQTDPVGERT